MPGVIVTRYDADGLALTLGEAFHPDLAGAEQFLGVGTQMPRDPGSLAAQVLDTHGPARVVERVAETGEDLDLHVPPETLGVHQYMALAPLDLLGGGRFPFGQIGLVLVAHRRFLGVLWLQ